MCPTFYKLNNVEALGPSPRPEQRSTISLFDLSQTVSLENTPHCFNVHLFYLSVSLAIPKCFLTLWETACFVLSAYI